MQVIRSWGETSKISRFPSLRYSNQLNVFNVSPTLSILYPLTPCWNSLSFVFSFRTVRKKDVKEGGQKHTLGLFPSHSNLVTSLYVILAVGWLTTEQRQILKSHNRPLGADRKIQSFIFVSYSHNTQAVTPSQPFCFPTISDRISNNPWVFWGASPNSHTGLKHSKYMVKSPHPFTITFCHMLPCSTFWKLNIFKFSFYFMKLYIL